MSAPRFQSLLNGVVRASWALFFLFLPVTSFPFLPPAIGGGALVRPLSIYPLLVLLALVTVPRLLTRPMPKTITALLPFVFIALFSSLLSLLRGLDPLFGITVSERIARALLTLALGCAFYFTVVLLPKTIEDLKFSLRWMYAGFVAALLWGSVQAAAVIFWNKERFEALSKLQRTISIRRLVEKRISGLTYEPNWFAEQLTFLLIPWLAASVLTGYSVFRWRWRFVTVELILLAWSVALLPFTSSRAGILNLLVLVFVALLFFRPHPGGSAARRRPFLATLARRAVELAAVVSVLGLLVYFVGTKNPFFARLWGYWASRSDPTIEGWFEYLGFGARFAYSGTAYRTYEAFPALGVGLGNYAFYFEDMLPDQPLATTPEVLRTITPDEGRNRLITAKNLYSRLLAETGIIGTIAFTAFIVAVTGCALFLWLSKQKEEKFWGTAGLLGMIVFFFSAASFDSFALPNMWVVFGLITTSAWMLSKQGAPADAAANSTAEQDSEQPLYDLSEESA